MSPQDIAEYLENERSKISINKLISKLDTVPIDISSFINSLGEIPFPVRWYMTWFLTHYVEANPEVGKQYQKHIWNTVKSCEHQGMLRDLWRTLTFIEVNDELSGTIYDQAVKTCVSQNNAVAVRAHAMLTAANIALPYPELRHELVLILNEFKQEESAGLRARSRNLIKKMKR